MAVLLGYMQQSKSVQSSQYCLHKQLSLKILNRLQAPGWINTYGFRKHVPHSNQQTNCLRNCLYATVSSSLHPVYRVDFKILLHENYCRITSKDSIVSTHMQYPLLRNILLYRFSECRHSSATSKYIATLTLPQQSCSKFSNCHHPTMTIGNCCTL